MYIYVHIYSIYRCIYVDICAYMYFYSKDRYETSGGLTSFALFYMPLRHARGSKTCTGACFRAFEASKHAQAHAFEPPSVLRACFEATEFDNTRRNTTSKPLDEALRRHWRRNRFENTILSTRSLRKLSTKLFEATGRSTSKALDEATGRRNWTKKLDEETGRINFLRSHHHLDN